MLSVSEAKNLVLENIPTSKTLVVPLQQAAYLTLAQPVYAQTDTPPFPQSSVDGYAFRYSDWVFGEPLKIQTEIPAGRNIPFELLPKSCARIFTGAPLPNGADTVAMQEHTETNLGQIIIQNQTLEKGSNARPQAAQTKKGALALPAEQILTPAALSYIAGLGISEVSVYAPPTVKLILTGNELATVGETLEYGQVYESNSFAISAVLSKWGARLVSTEKVKDDYELTRQKISDSLDVDILLITGGVSVGDYDFVTDALSEVGVQKIFHKIRQRPGKPLFFGRKSSTLVFGLPGNPASVLTCVYEYLSLAIGKLMHQNFYHTTTATLKHSYKKKSQLTHFFKGLEINGEVEILSNQESYLMNSFAAANCLVHLDEYTETFEVGQKLTITRLS